MNEPTRGTRREEGLGEKIARNWKTTIFVVSCIALFLALIHARAETYLDRQQAAAVQLAEAGDPAKGEPLIQAWVERAPLHVGETAKIWLRFRNATPNALSVRLEELHTPGMRPWRSEWAKVTGAWGGHKVGWRQATLDLAPGSETTVWTELVAERDGTVTVTPVVSAGTVNDPSSRRWVLPLQELRIISPFHSYWAQVAKSFITLLGVLVLPTAGGLLAFGFQQRQQRNVQERQELQRDIDHERQAWANMLPVSHKNNGEYYIPLGSAIRSFLDDLAELKKQPQDEERRRQAYFSFLYVLRRWRVLFDGGAGFYLKDRAGEELVDSLFTRFFILLFSHLTPEEKAQQASLVDLVEPDERYSTYMVKLGKDAEAGRLFERLCERVGEWLLAEGGALAICWLTLGTHVLMFEINRIYRFWYGNDPPFPRADLDAVLAGTRPKIVDEEGRKLLAALVSYEQQIQHTRRTSAHGAAARGAPAEVKP